MLRVGVIGAAGRMGSTVCKAVAADPDLRLVAGVDSSAAGERLAEVSGILASPTGEPVADETDGALVLSRIEAMDPSDIDVAVDFTRAASAVDSLRWCASHGVHAVSGTTGLTADDLVSLERAFSEPGGPGAVWAPNFAIGAVLMMRLVEIVAPYFDSVEIIEMHHDKKQDAPSGTATETARMLTAARAASNKEPWPPDPTRDQILPGARGAAGEGGVRIHSVRLPGLVAHQEVLFGAAGQTLAVRHDAYDRVSFMPGVLTAIKVVPDRPGFTIGLAALLGLP